MSIKKYLPSTTEAVKIVIVVVVATSFGIITLGASKIRRVIGRV
jgi:hypothetical protein